MITAKGLKFHELFIHNTKKPVKDVKNFLCVINQNQNSQKPVLPKIFNFNGNRKKNFAFFCAARDLVSLDLMFVWVELTTNK